MNYYIRGIEKDMKIQNFNDKEMKELLNADGIWIEVFKPDREFKIEGELLEGFIRDNVVLTTDKICVRYNWLLKDYVDIEPYGNGRQAWYRLTMDQFNKIKYYLQGIQ